MTLRSATERAYRYDLYIVPVWREPFDEMVEKHLPLPKQGSILEVNSGTGGLALDLAMKMGARGDVVATDSSSERLALARAKAAVKKVSNLTFLEKVPTALGLDDNAYALVIGDATLGEQDSLEQMLAEMARVCQPGGTVGLKLLTQGSFDEVFSVLWEALSDCHLLEYAVHVERLASHLPAVSDVERLFARVGLENAHCFVERREFVFERAEDFFESPLVEDYFFDQWFDFLPGESLRERVFRRVLAIIHREQRHSYFDVSIKATLAIGRKR